VIALRLVPQREQSAVIAAIARWELKLSTMGEEHPKEEIAVAMNLG
jgi:hypothetical protein